MTKASIIVVEDKFLVAQDLARTLERFGYKIPAVVPSAEEAIQMAGEKQPDLILMDIRLKGKIDGIQAAGLIRERYNIPTVYLTAYSDEDSIQRAKLTQPLGYLLKPFEERQLYTTIEMALNSARAGHRDFVRANLERASGSELEAGHLSLSRGESDRLRHLRAIAEFSHIIGDHPLLLQLLERVDLVACTDVTVHIYGENGTGKELIADALHNLSGRRGKNFVKLNCSAIPATLLESALFGHVKGAFTGANKDQEGFIEHAKEGTLFLDEVGDLSPEIQIKLLRLLQNREYSKIGETRVRKAEIRILTATNRNLKELVKAGRIREDFYYRINVFPLIVPALRERKTDILILAQHFVQIFNKLFSKKITGFSSDTKEVLTKYAWPGNVRELENAVKHAFIMVSHGLIEPWHLPQDLMQASNLSLGNIAEQFLVGERNSDQCDPGSEREVICEALRKAGGNRTKAAELLGFSRVTLWKKINKYALTSV